VSALSKSRVGRESLNSHGIILHIIELVIALESYSSHLEPSFLKVVLPPTSDNASIPPNFNLSPSYVTSIDKEFSRVYEEYTRRIAAVRAMSEEVVNLWAELGIPQAQTDHIIIKNYRDSPEQLGLHESDILRLQSKRDKLLEEKRSRERKVKELKATIEGLWDRLNVEELDRKRFYAGTRGCGLRVINELEAELDRLNELKRQNLHLFVEDARCKLQALWDSLYFSEEEMLDFTPAFSDVYSDALLSAHEAEIARLEALKEQRLPTLQLIDKHRSLIKDREDLAASSQDASRLMLRGQKGEKRDPTRLLREEKMRKRITKDLPKIEAELKKTLERFEDEYGRPFLVHGERYLDELAATSNKTLPPRSKTPSGPPPSVKSTKPTPALASASSRAGSVMRSAPSRAGARTPPGTMRAHNPLAASTTSAIGRLSPSKIPARVPLSSMKTGSNSPERRAPPPASHDYDTTTVRKMGPPARAPPPKMRDLFEPLKETPRDINDTENWRCASVASSNGSGPIREIIPEDIYDDHRREHMSYVPSSVLKSINNTPQTYSDLQHGHPTSYSQYPAQGRYVREVDSRQISTTSTTSQAVSGSENWETYDDASEEEPDARGGYYETVRTAQGGIRGVGGLAGKRAAPYGSPRPEGKKMRGMNDGRGEVLVEQGGRYVPASEGGWTDDGDAF
jgi:protein regulator of cytokinesis 1